MLHELIACMKQQQPPSTKLQALSLPVMIHLEPRSTTDIVFNAPSRACKMSLLDSPPHSSQKKAEHVYGISIQLDSHENPMSFETRLRDYSAQLSNRDAGHVCRPV